MTNLSTVRILDSLVSFHNLKYLQIRTYTVYSLEQMSTL